SPSGRCSRPRRSWWSDVQLGLWSWRWSTVPAPASSWTRTLFNLTHLGVGVGVKCIVGDVGAEVCLFFSGMHRSDVEIFFMFVSSNFITLFQESALK
ncbi:hypothetical protein E3U43_018802, partial [Larimichthys crocea]